MEAVTRPRTRPHGKSRPEHRANGSPQYCCSHARHAPLAEPPCTHGDMQFFTVHAARFPKQAEHGELRFCVRCTQSATQLAAPQHWRLQSSMNVVKLWCAVAFHTRISGASRHWATSLVGRVPSAKNTHV